MSSTIAGEMDGMPSTYPPPHSYPARVWSSPATPFGLIGKLSQELRNVIYEQVLEYEKPMILLNVCDPKNVIRIVRNTTTSQLLQTSSKIRTDVLPLHLGMATVKIISDDNRTCGEGIMVVKKLSLLLQRARHLLFEVTVYDFDDDRGSSADNANHFIDPVTTLHYRLDFSGSGEGGEHETSAKQYPEKTTRTIPGVGRQAFRTGRRWFRKRIQQADTMNGLAKEDFKRIAKDMYRFQETILAR